ncbi:hypothetical protein OIDMADRAFT_25984 [Oidiodendron maius Zn]|uniref:Methyltransferase domain-containing protein n=1 Tax=Oidiodendron maius (strain Zn) TaxID=913774 RepID=A0A0C3HT39_OIDMZ|nr:hypothetical protein OIDMADRAFT_25984 [Oidiodendron maius Zn]
MSSPRAAQASSSSPRRLPTARSSKSPSTSPPALIDTATQDQGQDAPIEADNDSNADTDSALGLGYEPNDDTEQERLDMLHHIFKLVLGGALYKAPIEEPLQRVLDFGTGTGIWAIDLAEYAPNPSWIPPNVKFVIDNVESPWIDNEFSSFDLIHGRSMSGSISDWLMLFSSCIEALKPGGWLEMQEFDVWFQSEEGQLPADSAIMEWQNYLDEASVMFGKKLNVAREMAPWMSEAGFEDVKEEVIKHNAQIPPSNPCAVICRHAQAIGWGKSHVLAQISYSPLMAVLLC